MRAEWGTFVRKSALSPVGVTPTNHFAVTAAPFVHGRRDMVDLHPNLRSRHQSGPVYKAGIAVTHCPELWGGPGRGFVAREVSRGRGCAGGASRTRRTCPRRWWPRPAG